MNSAKSLAHRDKAQTLRRPAAHTRKGVHGEVDSTRQGILVSGRAITGGVIYLIRDDGELVEMTEQEYDSEKLLQELLAKYPKLLAGDQMDSDNPRRWLFISREAGVPDEEGGSDRWAVDHLFLDQDGIPTLVEVKRSSDTRIRREVVGQMLDYAANAVVYWPLERIQAQFEATAKGEGLDAEQELASFLEDGVDPDEFWQRVKTNLQAAKVRLLFVADKIPPELRRVVEFLNAQMDPAEVLAVEIKQYVGPGRKTLVPRVMGQVAEAGRRNPRQGARWDEERFFAALDADAQPKVTALARDLLKFGEDVSGKPIEWGTGRERGAFVARLVEGGERFSLFAVYTTGQLSLNFGWNFRKIDGKCQDLSEKYRSLASSKLSLEFDQTPWERGWPMIDLHSLRADGAAEIKDLVAEYVSDVRQLLEHEAD